jgi:hypothetical protein
MQRLPLHRLASLGLFAALCAMPGSAQAQTVEELQQQINELKAMVAQLQAAQSKTASPQESQEAVPAAIAPTANAPTANAPAPAASQATASLPQLAAAPNAEAPAAAGPAIIRSKPWFERLRLRGYTQIRVNQIISGDSTAPAGVSRLRSVHDSGISDRSNFTFRRLRLVLQGDLNDHVSLYFQPDFATNVVNQGAGERREGFTQIRDAYIDIYPFEDRSFRLRFGQSKVPYGWENLQSSGRRLALDRTDAINSAVPGERDIGIVAYYTPAHVQRIWDRLSADGQKLFGNYGAFGLALYNGQGINKLETNNGLMQIAMATWPIEIGDQVVEFGGSVMRNRVQPELRSGGPSPVSYAEERAVVHAILYPQPFGLQAEWNWGKGPEFDTASQTIQTKNLQGGYIQGMVRVRRSAIGPFMPFARWQHYRGGWKAALNAPRLETDELELGVEFQPMPPLELTLSYGHAKRREADERRTGQAEGDILRAQLQWNY